jgi:MoxR-like ATPase
MKAVPELVQHIRDEMSKVVVGQDELRNQCVIALLCRGHVLIEGVPGIAKTLTVKALSRLLRLEFQRVQCTSDLMPADIVGTNVLNMATSAVAGVHGRASGHDRWQRVSSVTVLYRIRNAESNRVRRHLPTAGSSTGPVPAQAACYLSRAAGRGTTAGQRAKRLRIA